MPEKYGDDFAVGDRYTTPSITVTETHVINWAGLTMDFYPLHMDAEYAAKTEFGERLVHGPMIFALAVGLVFQAGFGGDAAIAWLGVDNSGPAGGSSANQTVDAINQQGERR